jgi:hypothetical protein
MKKISLLLMLLFLFFISSAQDRIIDYRYAPAYYHTPIGFVDDWQKTMVNERGALLYDFGPGPYVRPNTIIGVGARGSELKQTSQRLENAQTPIVITNLSGLGIELTMQSFAIVPRESHTAKSSAGKFMVKRRLGLTGALAWANPEGEADPAFRNVAWGTNRPIVYEIRVKPGRRKKVVLGICESYRTIPSLRMMEFHVEGSPVNTVDPIASGKRNQPIVVFFDAQDVNRDGILEIEACPSSGCKDPNVILNAIWVFPERSNISGQAVISGAATKQAEVYVDCGKEPEVKDRSTRIDALLVTSNSPSFVPLITVQTTRQLKFDSQSGVLKYEGKPFVVSKPKALSAQKTEQGWELELPKGTRKAEVIVINGYRLPENIAVVPDLQKERQRTMLWWSNDSRIPTGRITVSDPQVQHLFDASVRTLYQNRDIEDGYPQFQPGSTVYRGLWIHDGVYYIEAAALLGDTMSARLATEELFNFQMPNGRVRVIWPIEMQRETPMFLWTMERYSRVANNANWLRTNWSRVMTAMEYIHQMRERTMGDSTSTNYGLLPAGFVDGGIAGLTADYSTVYWTLIGIHSAVEMAQWLGKSQEQREWQLLYDKLLESFRRAAKRDVRHDQFGHPYLPVRVADTTTTDVPQRAQWAICEAIYLALIFPPHDSVAVGSLAMIDSTSLQGLPSSFGWMTGGIGVWFAPLHSLAHFAEGNVDRAVDVLYSFANHATPHGAWAEEQMPKGVSPRTTGDFPTTSATAGMLRSILYFLAYERGKVVEILHGVPKDWLKPGKSLRAKDLLTKFGSISVEATLSEDGRKGNLSVQSKGYGDFDDSMAQYTDSGNTLEVYFTAFKQLGYKAENGNELPDRMRIRWGQDLQMALHK